MFGFPFEVGVEPLTVNTDRMIHAVQHLAWNVGKPATMDADLNVWKEFQIVVEGRREQIDRS